MAIVPDTKNWTWVLDETCSDCGYDGPATEFREVPRLVRENAAAGALRLDEEDLAALDQAFPPPRRKVPLDLL